jgi:hypothetical protein
MEYLKNQREHITSAKLIIVVLKFLYDIFKTLRVIAFNLVPLVPAIVGIGLLWGMMQTNKELEDLCLFMMLAPMLGSAVLYSNYPIAKLDKL